MLRAGIKDLIVLAGVLAAGFASIIAMNGRIERTKPHLADDYFDSDLTVNGSIFKGYAFGMEGLVADYYFMRSLQYVGDKLLKSDSGFINIDDLRSLNPRLLYPMLDNATDLDPHFIAAYSYGAVVLPAIDPDKAIKLANKGIANNPERWRLYQHLGYIYWKLGRYDQASEAYERGSRIPGASSFMKMMAASMLSNGGSRETARAIFTEMLATSNDEQTQITARRRLAELDSLDERDAIDKVLSEHRNSAGKCAASLEEMLPMLARVNLPNGRHLRIDASGRLVDPTNAPYLLDRETCRVMLDAEHTGLPVKK